MQLKGPALVQQATAWFSSCLGVLRYGAMSSVPSDLSALPRPTLANETELMAFAWTDPYETMEETHAMPRGKVDREYILLNTQESTTDGLGMRWMINNATMDMSRLMTLTTPILFDLYDGKESNLLEDVTYTLGHDEIVDIVLQNTASLNGVCESHPFHLHGHKFWVHSYGTWACTTSRRRVSHPYFEIL